MKNNSNISGTVPVKITPNVPRYGPEWPSILEDAAHRLEEKIKEDIKSLRRIQAEIDTFRAVGCTCLVRNESTPETKAIWDGVEKAASRCPEWAKERVNKLALESRKRMQSRCPVHGKK